MTRPILITGATGTVGSAVVDALLNAGRAVRAAGTDIRTIKDRWGDAVEAVALDFTDSRTWEDAFAGVDLMFLMRPPHLSRIRRDMVPALEAAERAGVRHMVLLSLQGAEGNRVVPHAKLEAWLRDSDLEWTFVRPSFFMENLTGTHRADIAERDLIMVPAGEGLTSFVAAEDVGAVAAAALLDPASHAGRAWTPTGPGALSYATIAETLSEVLGRPIDYGEPGALRFAVHARRRLRMPWGMVVVTTAIYTVARLGKAAGVTDDVRHVTGRDPLDFASWARSHREHWARGDV